MFNVNTSVSDGCTDNYHKTMQFPSTLQRVLASLNSLFWFYGFNFIVLIHSQGSHEHRLQMPESTVLMEGHVFFNTCTQPARYQSQPAPSNPQKYALIWSRKPQTLNPPTANFMHYTTIIRTGSQDCTLPAQLKEEWILRLHSSDGQKYNSKEMLMNANAVCVCCMCK